MGGLIYNNEIMSIRLCLSEQINDRDLPGEKHHFAIRTVPPDSDGQFNASHLWHHHIGDQEIGRLRLCRLQGSERVSERTCVETSAQQNEFESRSEDILVIDHKYALFEFS